jgi:hypothetical protein
MKKTIEPIWAGLATFVAYLYTVWAMQHFYADITKGGGAGVMAFYIISLFAFPLILAVALLFVGGLLSLSQNVQYRAIVIVACTAAFFLLHGALGPIALFIGAAFSCYMYVRTKRTWEDQEELARFE